MRLHHLTMQAVGPFAGRHVVDFAALSAGGLFLLEGPTGAGKSTVIDAIVFALYGKVASASASEDRLRSAFAADDTETVVELVFETGAGVYRVRRTPAYERAKRRGTGRARQQATVQLWRLTGAPELPRDGDEPPAGELLSTRLDEAGAELTRVVGLDRAQFVQTMVLPQGEFAAFLRADPEQRRGLLQRIFGTEVYEQVQQRLDELRREAQRGVTDARAYLQECVARFAGASGADEDAVAVLRDAAADDTAAVPALVEERLAALRQQVDEARLLATRAAAHAAEVRTAAQAAADRLRLVRRRVALLDEQLRLESAAEQHAADVARVDVARRAAVVRPALRGLDDAVGARSGARKELRAALDAAPTGLAPGDADAALADPGLPGALRAVREAGAALVATLARVVAIEDALPRRERERDRLRDELEIRVRVMAEADALLADRPAGRATLVEQLDAATDLAATAPARARDLADAQAVLGAVRDLVAAEQDLAAAVEARSAAATTARSAVQEEARLRTARLDGFAGELAAGLVADQPCPVCGSAEHPHPAPLGADHVREEDVTAAEQHRRTAEQAVNACDGTVVSLTARCTGLRERIEGLTAVEGAAGPGDAAAGLAEAAAERVRLRQDDLAEAEAAAHARDRLKAAVAEHDRDTEQLRSDRVRLGDAHVEASHALARAEQQIAADRVEVEQAREDHPTVLARQGAEQARVDGAAGVLAALDRCAQADRAVTARAEELAGLLDEQGFADEDAARAAVAAGTDAAAAERAVQAHRAAVARVADGLADPEVAAVADEDPAAVAGQVAALDDALARTRAEAEVAAAALGSVQDRAERAEAAAVHVGAATAALTAAASAAGPVTRMARLAGGADADNARALSLATYVLVRRFEDVVAAANDRLREMSDGRYELERSDEKEDVRSRRTGLAMRVLDHTTGAGRDPRTLSGGETFYVALCLALGMADVVTAEAGGVELGTLFIDEGFGSLDPHTLDAVLGELGRLRAGGRVVGVVSHVEAMKQAVAERIEVRRRGDGSSTLTVVAG
ncbi:AAA family ATPase [Cellulomonas sp. NPDC058312]|uniref:AAA family ATPase n=1 Tax=Cellulomonas sp. NPDC058312 TaxID=3346441 RepID=UPI0036EB03D8